MKRYQKTAVVLAGGVGSRMGHVDKAFLMYKGKSFIECILDKLEGYEEIIVVSNNREKYDNRNSRVRIVEDSIKGIGPLGGIYTGLMSSTYDEMLVISCDTPFQHQGFLDYLGNMSGEYEVVLPIHSDGREPLTAIYKRSLVGEIEKMIAEKRYKIAFLYEKARMKRLDIEEFKEGKAIKEGFKNINTPEELRMAGGKK